MERNRKTKHAKSPVAGEAVDRREFLAAATGLASAAWLAKSANGAGAPMSPTAAMGPLAIDGGPPVRATMLEAKLSGP